MSDIALEIKDLVKTYPAQKGASPKQALRDVSLAIPRGSVFGLLGPNGAGKSTLINILAGLVLKTSGHVRIWGFDQDENPRQSRAAIGVMPQELNLDPFFTPRGALEVQAGLYGVPKAERLSDEILRLVGLEDKAHVYARTLSGGMRRRLLLGKALVHRPNILVLDEPTAGVDIELRQMLWDNVRMLNQKGTTIILTTHYLQEAEEMCDEIAIIHQGQIVTQDTTKNLLSQIDEKTMLITPEARIDTLPKIEGVAADWLEDGRLRLQYAAGEVSAQRILSEIHAAGIAIRDVRTQQADLEDIFLKLTKTDKNAP